MEAHIDHLYPFYDCMWHSGDFVFDTPTSNARWIQCSFRLKLSKTSHCDSPLQTFVACDSEDSLKMISRNEWTAQPPELEPIPLNLPVDRMIIAHTNTTSCDTKVSLSINRMLYFPFLTGKFLSFSNVQAHCALIVRTIQADHMDVKKMNDIAYNFLIGGSGTIYHGRGWNVEGQHTDGFNANSLCIAMVGTFDVSEPPLKQLNAAKQLIAEASRLQKMSENYRLYGQRQLIANTTSPGQRLYELLTSTWPHWTAEVK